MKRMDRDFRVRALLSDAFQQPIRALSYATQVVGGRSKRQSGGLGDITAWVASQLKVGETLSRQLPSPFVDWMIVIGFVPHLDD